jgi:N-acetylglucosamine-6-sulfatase
MKNWRSITAPSILFPAPMLRWKQQAQQRLHLAQGRQSREPAGIPPNLRSRARLATRSLTALGLLVALTMPSRAQPAAVDEPCSQIRAACEQAGFVYGRFKSGLGLDLHCIRPIMGRVPQPAKAALPLPSIDAALVAACKASDPNFGYERRAPRRRSAGLPIAPDSAPAIPPADTRAAPSADAAPPSVPAKQPAQSRPLQSAPAPAAAGRRPNIVFVLTDDLSMNLLQYMPHVLQMQKDGVSFARYFVTDSLCCPSRTSIFTGRYPHDTGVFTNTGNDGGYLQFRNRGLARQTFAAALAATGYRTAMLGKYLNGYRPQNPPEPGWSSWAVAGNGYKEFNYNLNQNGQIVRHGNDPADYLTDVVAGVASSFIRQSADAPFLIEVATFAPHRPFTPAPRDADAFPGLRVPRTPAYNIAPDANAPTWLKMLSPLSASDMSYLDLVFRMRAQSVLAVDAMIGELQAAVAAIGQQDNTYFVFSSDNGFHLGDHRMTTGKMTAFDHDIQVPLIVTGPGVPAGRTVEEIAENVDLCPTFEELAGTPIPANVDGRSLVPLLHGQKLSSWRTAALVEHHGPVNNPTDPDRATVRTGNPPSYEAIRTATATYVEYVTGEKEYYDVNVDPYELRNAYSSLDAASKASLHTLLSALQNCHDAQSCAAADVAAPGAMQK